MLKETIYKTRMSSSTSSVLLSFIANSNEIPRSWSVRVIVPFRNWLVERNVVGPNAARPFFIGYVFVFQLVFPGTENLNSTLGINVVALSLRHI